MSSAAISGIDCRRGGKSILREFSIPDLRPGITALVGANGSGKSTLLRCVAGLLEPRRGQVTVDGQVLRTRGSRAGRVAYLEQEPRYWRHYTVQESLDYAAWLLRIPHRSAAGEIEGLTARLDLTAVRRTLLRKLSGGTRQRVYLAQILLGAPTLLLLDEPTAGLDAAQRIALRGLLRELADTHIVLLTTHLAEDVALLADRAVGITAGTVGFDEEVDGLLGASLPDSERAASVESLMVGLS